MLTDAIATMVNATGDAVAAMMVTKLVEGKNWMDQGFEQAYASLEDVKVS